MAQIVRTADCNIKPFWPDTAPNQPLRYCYKGNKRSVITWRSFFSLFRPAFNTRDQTNIVPFTSKRSWPAILDYLKLRAAYTVDQTLVEVNKICGSLENVHAVSLMFFSGSNNNRQKPCSVLTTGCKNARQLRLLLASTLSSRRRNAHPGPYWWSTR